MTINPYESPTHCQEQSAVVSSPWWHELGFVLLLYTAILAIVLLFGPFAIAATFGHKTPPSFWEQVEFCLLGAAWQVIAVLAVLGFIWQIV